MSISMDALFDELTILQKVAALFAPPEQEKLAGHFDDRVKQRAMSGTEQLAAEHARKIQDGLGALHQEHGDVIKNHFNEGDTFHIDMAGGGRGIIQKIGDRFVAKTGLEKHHGNTSKGDFVQALHDALARSSLTRRR